MATLVVMGKARPQGDEPTGLHATGGNDMKYVTAALGILLVLAASMAHADTVTAWNQTAIEVMKVANIAGNPWSRTLAMVHVAMADAINAV
jgi:hypothetical protein